jgi:hypothetical protein
MRYWIKTISRAHVHVCVGGGFTQADHGKNTRLKRLEKGDPIAFYSPRTEFRSGEPLQVFIAWMSFWTTFRACAASRSTPFSNRPRGRLSRALRE